MIDGQSRKLIWSKFSSNNKAKTACDLFLKAEREHATPLKVRGNMGSENRPLAKHVILLRNGSHYSYTSIRSTHKTRVNHFWRKHNTTVKDHFLEHFKNLEFLGILKTTEKI